MEPNMHRLSSKKEVAARVHYHPEHIMRLVRQQRFPKPIRLGSSSNSAVRFIDEEVDAWLAARVAERDAIKG
jgi:predicted DNA-binding transcriptional regulator AlpA